MVWFLKLVVSRSLHHTTFASVVDILLILISAGMLAFYFALAIIDRPSRRVDKKVDELAITEERDYDYYGCLCTVKTIGYGDFIDYPGYDDDYAFCVGDPPYTNPANSFRGRFGLTASSVCDTATYKLQALLKPDFDDNGNEIFETGRGTWRFSRDNLVTNNTLRNDVKGQIGLFIFDIWNLLSDSLKFTEVLLDRVIRDGGISGNVTTMHSIANKTYVEVALPIEARLNILKERMFDSLRIDYAEYLRRCQPRGCFITERVGPETVLLSAAAIVGGNLALFTAIGNAIVKYAEDRYLNQLFQKYLTGQITEQEKEFLRANSPAMATLVDEDGKGIPPGTTLADLNRLKSSGLKSPGTHQVNVGPQGSGPVPI